MPWNPSDATKHTRKAKSLSAKRKWAKTANAVLEESGDEEKAMKVANSAVSKRKKKGTKMKNR